MEEFFSPNASEYLRLDADQSQIIGGDADVHHIQIIGGMYPPSPQVLAPLLETCEIVNIIINEFSLRLRQTVVSKASYQKAM